MFGAQNFLVVGGSFRMNIIPLNRTNHFNDLLLDLHALSNSLLQFHWHGNMAALYTNHLHYLITNPPLLVWNSLVFQSRYIILIYYHFAYSSTCARTVFFSSLATAKNYLGQNDTQQFHVLLKQAWDELEMDKPPFHVGLNWTNEALKNPVFFEIMMGRNNQTRGVPRANGYSATPPSLYSFGRNSDVHGPEKTKGPATASLGQTTAAPSGAGHWQWQFDQVCMKWKWVWLNAQGLWHWPTVPADVQWRTKWPAAPPPPLPAPAAILGQNIKEQKMSSSDSVGLMLGKGFGMFFAHASSLILIFLQASTPEYIDIPYQTYQRMMDSM